MVQGRRVGIVHQAPGREAQAVRLELEMGRLRVGDTVHIRGADFQLQDRIRSMTIEGHQVEMARAGDIVEVELEHVPAVDEAEVYLVQDPYAAEMGAVLHRFGPLNRIPPAPGLALPQDGSKIRSVRG